MASMKAATLAILVVCSVALSQTSSTPYTKPRDDPGTFPGLGLSVPGRFVLVSGKWNNIANNDPVETLYRIDSATGRVWELSSAVMAMDAQNRFTGATPMWREVAESDSWAAEVSAKWLQRLAPKQ